MYHIGDGGCVREPGANLSTPVTVQNIYPSIQEVFFYLVGPKIHTFLVFYKDPSESIISIKVIFFFFNFLQTYVWTHAGGDSVHKV